MIIPLSAERATSVSKEFMQGTVRKEYIARCKGEFPACVLAFPSACIPDFDFHLQRRGRLRSTIVDCRPSDGFKYRSSRREGVFSISFNLECGFSFASQPAKTIFTRLHYDANTDTSVLHCMKPFKPFLQLRLTLIALGQPFTGRCKLPV